MVLRIIDTRTPTERESELLQQIRELGIKHKKAYEEEAAPLIKELTQIQNMMLPKPVIYDDGTEPKGELK